MYGFRGRVGSTAARQPLNKTVIVIIINIITARFPLSWIAAGHQTPDRQRDNPQRAHGTRSAGSPWLGLGLVESWTCALRVMCSSADSSRSRPSASPSAWALWTSEKNSSRRDPRRSKFEPDARAPMNAMAFSKLCRFWPGSARSLPTRRTRAANRGHTRGGTLNPATAARRQCRRQHTAEVQGRERLLACRHLAAAHIVGRSANLYSRTNSERPSSTSRRSCRGCDLQGAQCKQSRPRLHTKILPPYPLLSPLRPTLPSTLAYFVAAWGPRGRPVVQTCVAATAPSRIPSCPPRSPLRPHRQRTGCCHRRTSSTARPSPTSPTSPAASRPSRSTRPSSASRGLISKSGQSHPQSRPPARLHCHAWPVRRSSALPTLPTRQAAGRRVKPVGELQKGLQARFLINY